MDSRQLSATTTPESAEKFAVVETFTQSDLSGIAIRSEVCPREEEQSGPSVGERELPAVGDLLAQLLDDLIDLHIWID